MSKFSDDYNAVRTLINQARKSHRCFVSIPSGFDRIALRDAANDVLGKSQYSFFGNRDGTVDLSW